MAAGIQICAKEVSMCKKAVEQLLAIISLSIVYVEELL